MREKRRGGGGNAGKGRDEGDERGEVGGNRDAYVRIRAEARLLRAKEEMDDDEGWEKTAATETPQRAINKFDTRVGKLAKLPASGVSI